jgi:hypothetical protein
MTERSLAPYWRILRALFVVLAFACGLAAVLVARQSVPVGVAAGVVGLVFVGFATFTGGMARRVSLGAARREAHPNEPWLWAEEWEGGRIAAESEWRLALLIAGLALAWNAAIFGVGLYFYVRDTSVDDLPLRIFLVVGGVSAVLLIPVAVRMLFRARRHGPGTLELPVRHGIIGGPVEGLVQLPPEVPREGEALVALRCSEHVVASAQTGGGSRSTRLWQDETRSSIQASGLLPVSFSAPFALPDSSPPWKTGSTVTWELVVSVPSADYTARFRVPVFKTPASDPKIVAGAVDASRPAPQPPGSRTRVLEAGPSGAAIELPNQGGLLAGAVVALVPPLLAWSLGRYQTAGLLIAAGIVVLLVSAVLFNATHIDVDRNTLRVKHGRWPLRWTRTIPIQEIAEFKFDPRGSQETGHVEARLKNGKHYWVSINLAGLEEAKWLATELTRLLDRYR